MPVTLVALIFWGWLLGRIGAILAIPLTLLVKAILVDTDPTASWVVALFGSTRQMRGEVDADTLSSAEIVARQDALLVVTEEPTDEEDISGPDEAVPITPRRGATRISRARTSLISALFGARISVVEGQRPTTRSSFQEYVSCPVFSSSSG